MNQEKLYQLFEKSTVAIIIFDTQNGIHYVNQPSLRLLHYEKHDLKNQPFSLLIPTSLHSDIETFIESGEKIFSRSQIYLQGSENLSLSANLTIQRISRKDTMPAVYLATIYPLYSEPIKVSESGITNEVSFSETHKLLRLLKKETDLPLGTLHTLTERLLSLQPRSDQMPLLENILHSGHELQGAIEQVLLYADLVGGRIDPDLEPFNLHALLKELEDGYHVQAQERKIDFKLLADDDLPATLVGDASLIRQILGKLLDHLFAFTSERSIKMQVLLESKIASIAILKFSLITHGLTPKHMLWLKQIFFSTSAQLPQEWDSIGLHIADQLTKKIGGVISLENEPVTAIGIHISLSLAPEDDLSSKKGKANPPIDLVQGGPPLRGLKVLYVEDVIPNHFLMEGLCSIWKVSLDTALNGQEALDKLQYNVYDVILMDLQMPIMNGYETARRIRHTGFSRNSSVPIVAVSGSATDETITQIKRYGMNSFLPKPIKPDKLYQKLLEVASS